MRYATMKLSRSEAEATWKGSVVRTIKAWERRAAHEAKPEGPRPYALYSVLHSLCITAVADWGTRMLWGETLRAGPVRTSWLLLWH